MTKKRVKAEMPMITIFITDSSSYKVDSKNKRYPIKPEQITTIIIMKVKNEVE